LLQDNRLVRRFAYEAAETGLLSPELVADIRRVRGSKKLGMRIGNWLTVNEARSLRQLPDGQTIGNAEVSGVPRLRSSVATF